MDLTVVDAPDQARYEARTADGTVAGFAAYQLAPHVVVMTHTEVDHAYEGQGVATTLIRGALDDIASRGLHVVPLCPFVAAFLKRHPDYGDLVYKPPATRATD
jgi:predicted GNAT family acetyltransferase